MRCSPIWDLAYQTLVLGLCIIAKYRDPECLMASCQCFNHFSKSLTGSLSPLSVHHICWGELLVLFRMPPCLVLDFLRTEPLCLHLPFAEWWSLPRTHCSGLDGLWTPCVLTNSWSWCSWGQRCCDFLIYLRSRKLVRPLDCKTELCWVIFHCLDSGAILLWNWQSLETFSTPVRWWY